MKEKTKKGSKRKDEVRSFKERQLKKQKVEHDYS